MRVNPRISVSARRGPEGLVPGLGRMAHHGEVDPTIRALGQSALDDKTLDKCESLYVIKI